MLLRWTIGILRTQFSTHSDPVTVSTVLVATIANVLDDATVNTVRSETFRRATS